MLKALESYNHLLLPDLYPPTAHQGLARLPTGLPSSILLMSSTAICLYRALFTSSTSKSSTLA